MLSRMARPCGGLRVARLFAPSIAACRTLSAGTCRRSLSTSAPPPEEAPPVTAASEDEPAALVFEGPKAGLVRTMKMVSVGNLSFAIVAAPLLYLVTDASGSPGKGIAMSALLLTFGGGWPQRDSNWIPAFRLHARRPPSALPSCGISEGWPFESLSRQHHSGSHVGHQDIRQIGHHRARARRPHCHHTHLLRRRPGH